MSHPFVTLQLPVAFDERCLLHKSPALIAMFWQDDREVETGFTKVYSNFCVNPPPPMPASLRSCSCFLLQSVWWKENWISLVTLSPVLSFVPFLFSSPLLLTPYPSLPVSLRFSPPSLAPSVSSISPSQCATAPPSTLHSFDSSLSIFLPSLALPLSLCWVWHVCERVHSCLHACLHLGQTFMYSVDCSCSCSTLWEFSGPLFCVEELFAVFVFPLTHEILQRPPVCHPATLERFGSKLHSGRMELPNLDSTAWRFW